MSLPKLLTAQNDFSGGEINIAAKRQDTDAAVKTGARQMANWRIEGTGSLVPRPGRAALFVAPGVRTDYVRMSPTKEFFVAFSAGRLAIYTLGGTLVTSNTSAAYLWTDTTVTQISWCQAGYMLVFCFPGMRPQLATYTPSTDTWAFSAFSFRVQNGITYQPFYRIAAPGVTITYTPATTPITNGATTYNIPTQGQTGLPVTMSAPYFTSDMVGSMLSIVGQQCTIASVTSPTTATVNVAYLLPLPVGCLVTDTTPFQIGQIIDFKIQGLKLECATVNQGVGASSPGGGVSGTLLSSVYYPGAGTIAGEQLISVIGEASVSYGPNIAGFAMTIQWAEPFMSDRAGWPASCFYDKGRLGFCDFPQKPEAILWSAVGAPDVFWVDAGATYTNQAAGALPDSAILEFLPTGVRVRHVVGWGDQFVFTDRGIWQVPVSTSAPLKPGGVEFRQFSNDGVAPIKPVPTQDTIVYINSGKQRVSVVRATGSYTRPYVSEDQSNMHSHLFTSPRQLIVATGDGFHPERYIYVVNDDGSVAVGKFDKNRTAVGWVPWTGGGAVGWATVTGANVYYVTVYSGNAIVEAETDGCYLDASIPLNAVPAGMTPPTGKGPLWFAPNATVGLIDGQLDRGTRSIDANGFIVPEQPGEDLSSSTLTAGFIFQPTLEPFPPDAQAGQYEGQRQIRRKIARAEVVVENSTGFVFGSTSIPAYSFGDDASAAPTLQEKSYSIRTLGRSHSPRPPLVIKDRPGPLRVVEYSLEMTV